MPHQSRRDLRAAREVTNRGRAERRRTVRRRVWIGVGIAVVVFLALGAWVGFKALTVKNELEAAQADVAAIQAGADMKTTLVTLGEHAEAASSAASDPVWRVFEFIPAAGDNLRAVRLAADSLDILSNDVGVPILADEGSDVGVTARALPVMDAMGPKVSELADEVEAIVESPFLIGPVRRGIDQVAEVMLPAGTAMSLLPSMLGVDGERNYLLVFQNNAESLALGGSAASQTLVRVENGSMEIADQAGSIKFNNGTEVDVSVDQSALDLYTRYLVSHVNTTVSRPDFPTAAKLLTAFWQRDINPAPLDGVISIDPLALARVLKATGPITVMGRELTHENAVKILLSDVYQWWDSYADPEIADAFFGLVAEQVFSKISSGSFDIKDMLWAVTTSIDNGDIMVYSEDPTFAEVIAGERVSGVLPTENGDATTLGVYFRDTSASKIDYYMKSSIDITGSCSTGTSTFDVSSSLHLDISQSMANALPRYVQSYHWGATHFRTEVFVYGPPGTTLQSATVDGRDARPTRTDISDLGRPVAAFETYLRPGETATVDAVFAGTGDFGPLALQSTPMIQPTVKQLTGAACG